MSFDPRPALSVGALLGAVVVLGLLAVGLARGLGSAAEPAAGVAIRAPPESSPSSPGSIRARLPDTAPDPLAGAAGASRPVAPQTLDAQAPLLHGRLQLEGDGDPTSALIELLPAEAVPVGPADDPTSARPFSPAPDGSFQFARPARAPFELRASAPGHVPIVRRGLLPGSRLQLFLPRSRRLVGTVRDARDGRFVAGASVVAETCRGGDVLRAATVTDAHGAFELPDLPEQIDRLLVEAVGFLPADVPELSAGTGSPVDVALIRSRSVLVRVIDGTLQEPLDDVVFNVPFEVQAEPGLYRLQLPPVGPDGAVLPPVEVSCPGYLSEQTRFVSGAPGPVAGEAGGVEPRSSIDPRIHRQIVLRRSAWVSDVVRSASATPVASAQVQARVVHGADVPAAWSDLTVTTSTAADGRFRLEGLPPGLSLSLVACASGWRPARVAPLHAPEEGGLAGVDLKLETAAGLTGRVVDESGQPLPGALVVAVQDLLRLELLSDGEG